MREQLAAYAGPAPEEDVAIGAGDACSCRWGEKWFGAKVLSVDESEDTCRVHFLGWSKHYDGDYSTEYVRPAR